MRGPIAALAITALATGCSSPSRQPDGPLPILADYPASINATAMTGSIHLQPDGCLVFTRADGEKMLPVFRPGTSIEALQSQLGALTDPTPISIMGVTVLERVPDEIEIYTSRRKCSQIPFVFGSIGSGDALPPPPPIDAPMP